MSDRTLGHGRAKIGDLSTEIWIKIFEELYHLEPYDHYSFVPPLQRLRLVSRWFNIVVTPFLYRRRYLRARCLANLDDPRTEKELASIRAFTNELVMPDYHGINDALLGPAAEQIFNCRVLSLLKWHTSSPATSKGARVPTVVLDAFLRKPMSHVRVEINRNWFTAAPHCDSKVLGFIERSSESSSQLGSQRSNDALELLDIVTLPYHHVLPPFDKRLPPMKQLVLRYYQWSHSIDEYEALWDFSQLQFLCLHDVPIETFLASVPPKDLAGLRCLHVIFHSIYLSRFESTAKSLFDQLFKTLKELKELEIFGPWDRMLHVVSITRLSKLRVLRLKDRYLPTTVVSSHDGEWKPKRLELAELKTIQKSCKQLVGIELDLNLEIDGDGPEVLDLLATFPNLQRVQLIAMWTPIPVEPPECSTPDDSQGSDEDDAWTPAGRKRLKRACKQRQELAVNSHISHLRQAKLGVPFSMISIHLGKGLQGNTEGDPKTRRFLFIDPETDVDHLLWRGDHESKDYIPI